MGGNAFKEIISNAVFPRMNPAQYKALQTRCIEGLRGLYAQVTVAREAPEKKDYGDLDILVVLPSTKDKTALPKAEEVAKAMGADYWQEAFPQSNFAIRDLEAEVALAEGGVTEGERKKVYRQVDVNVIPEEDWEMQNFWFAYGDLGMVLGLIARSNGLYFGSKGLRVKYPLGTIQLTSIPRAILDFYGLSYEKWESGFATREELFDWISTSRIFWLDKLSRSEHNAHWTAAIQDRPMIGAFFEYLEGRVKEAGGKVIGKARQKDDVIAEALKVFGKEKERQDMLDAESQRHALKENFSGTLVKEWTGLPDGAFLGHVMQKSKERLGGKEGILSATPEKIEATVKEVFEELKD